MALLFWGPALAVGVGEIDAQHQRLIDLVNQLNDAFHAGMGKEALVATLADLVSSTIIHFATEERLMAQHSYSSLAQHKAEHKQLIADIGTFKAKFEAGSVTMSAEFTTFLSDWLSRHITQTDKKLGQALNKTGLK